MKVKSWSCRLFRWLNERELSHFFAPLWACGVMLALAAGLTCAVVWQWSGVIMNPKMDIGLRVFSLISNPFGWAIVAVLAFTGLSTHLYRGLTLVWRLRLAQHFGNEIAQATKDFGYLIHQDVVDRILGQLAAAVSSGDDNDRRRFWRANNAAWSFGFEVHGVGHYLSGKEGR